MQTDITANAICFIFYPFTLLLFYLFTLLPFHFFHLVALFDDNDATARSC